MTARGQSDQQPGDTPSFSVGEPMSSLDPRYPSLLRLEIALGGAVTIALALLLYSILLRQALVPAAVLAAASGITLALVLILVPERRYRSWSYALSPHELHVKHGVWTRFYKVVPIRRIQHIDVAQRPVARWFGLASLVVHTAGTRTSSVEIPGLQQGEAERLRDELRQSIRLDRP